MITIIKFFLVLLIMWPMYAQPQEPPTQELIEHKPNKTNDPTHYSAKEKPITKQVPLNVSIPSTPTGENKAKHEPSERNEKMTYEKWLTYSTGWLALVTTALAIFTGYLWNATRKMVHNTEETAKRQLRAFIFGKGFSHGPNLWDGEIKEYVFFVTWENVGLTPGIDVCNWFQIKTVPVNEEQQIIFTPTTERQPTVMGPRATAQTSYLTIPLENMMKCWRKEIAILIWSRVEYRDIFDSTILHHHEQCASIDFIHDPSVIPPGGHPPYIQFTIHGPQNSTG